MIHAQRAEFAAAEAWLRRSVRLNPWNANARADLGIVIHRQGRPVEAERHLRWALKDFPGMEKPSSELAELFFDAGRFAEALAWLSKGAALDPERTDIHNLMGFCHFKRGERRAGGGGFPASDRPGPYVGDRLRQPRCEPRGAR